MVVNRQNNVLISALIIGVMMGCAPEKPQQNVWDLYDIRYPVPAGSDVPVSRATIYDRYTDNDDFYVPPTNFGSCGSDNIGFGGCE